MANVDAFAALKIDGSVVTWGDADSGGDCSAVGHQLAGEVEQIVKCNFAFAAIKIDGSVVPWGWRFNSGDCTAVRHQLES